jgi:FixJ family two-component response regulator
MPATRLHVAVIDDETPVRMALVRILRLAGYDTSEYSSGEVFLASLAVAPPDLVILDVHMPGLSGLGVQSRLRAAHRELPVLFITASDDSSLDLTVSQSANCQLLRKPFSSDALLAALVVASGTD